MTRADAANEWRYWWPDRGETAEDERYWTDRPDRTHEFVASDIAERDFYRGDPWREDEMVLVSPGGVTVRYAIEVESRPHFSLRPSATPTGSGNDG